MHTGGQRLIDKRKQRQPRTRVNWMIRVPEVRVIDSTGEQLGIMPTEKALALAEERELDLVEVSPTARPPVCRIVDYGKYKYEANKRQRQSRKKQHTVQVKEVKLRPKIEEHDYQFKKRHAEEFLEKLDKVKFTVIFRGRELDHKELGAKLLERVVEDLKEVGVVERPAQFEGRLMTMYLGPSPAAVKKRTAELKEQEQKAKKAEANPAAAGNDQKSKKAEANPAAAGDDQKSKKAEANPAPEKKAAPKEKAEPAKKEDQDAKA